MLSRLVGEPDLAGLSRYTRGWLEGTVRLEKASMVFTPGRLAKRAGCSEFRVFWADVRCVETTPQRLSFNTSLRLTLEDGSIVSGELRGGSRLADALLETELASDT
jgi:hypothetical protein